MWDKKLLKQDVGYAQKYIVAYTYIPTFPYILPQSTQHVIWKVNFLPFCSSPNHVFSLPLLRIVWIWSDYVCVLYLQVMLLGSETGDKPLQKALVKLRITVSTVCFISNYAEDVSDDTLILWKSHCMHAWACSDVLDYHIYVAEVVNVVEHMYGMAFRPLTGKLLL